MLKFLSEIIKIILECDKMKNKSLKIAGTAIFSAMGVAMEFLPLDIPFPLFTKLTLDPTGIPLALAFFIFGFNVASIATFITALSIALPRPKGPNIPGAFFKGLAEFSTILGISISKRFWKNEMLMAISSSIFGVLVRITTMCITCLIFLPLFYGMPQIVVLKIIPIIAIFNLIQGLLNILVALSLYKAIKKRIAL